MGQQKRKSSCHPICNKAMAKNGVVATCNSRLMLQLFINNTLLSSRPVLELIPSNEWVDYAFFKGLLGQLAMLLLSCWHLPDGVYWIGY